MGKYVQLKNHPDFKIEGLWVQKFVSEPGVVQTTRSGVLWTNLTQRCKEGGALQDSVPAYKGCVNAFSDFQHLAEWCQTQIGYLSKDSSGRFWQLDKDILVKGNKVYSPDTCCFVPKALNCLLESNKKMRGEYPIGVRKDKNKFCSQVQRHILGLPAYTKTFDTPTDAFMDYKEVKESYIKDVADYYQSLIDPRVYQALYNYEVHLND